MNDVIHHKTAGGNSIWHCGTKITIVHVYVRVQLQIDVRISHTCTCTCMLYGSRIYLPHC